MFHVYQLNTAPYVTSCITFVDGVKAIKWAMWQQERTDAIHGMWHYRVTRFKGLNAQLQPIHEIVWDGRMGGF